MDIKSVIQRHGILLQDVSARMKVKHSTLSGMISGNPTISTLRKISEAINAINEERKRADRCYISEFFADELPIGFMLQSTALQPSQTEQSAPSPADELLFKDKEPKQESMPGVVICPHCKGRFVAEIIFKSAE